MLSAAKRLGPMAVLYGGRIGVAALGLLILPWLSRLMPAEDFGLAATILSFQSLAVIVDLGLSTTIAREFPVMKNARDCGVLMRRSERTLFRAYVAVGAVAGVLAAAGAIPVSLPTALLACLSLLLVVWQNVLVVALISQQRYLTSTASQFSSLLLRHCCSLALVLLFAGTLQAFVIGQVIGAAAILSLSRYAFLRREGSDKAAQSEWTPASTTNIAMMVYAIAGACAMQLDKVLLSALSSPISTGPYFLATTLSLVPITFLAAPASQFIQPRLIASLVSGEERQARLWATRLTLAITVLAVLPGIALALAAPWVVGLWLHGGPHQEAVGRYTSLMMPGASLGAVGLVPAIVLIARRDYKAMAAISSVLSVAVLSTTALLAAQDNISGVCVAYAGYHVLAAIALWWRASQIEPSFLAPLGVRFFVGNGNSKRSADARI